ncbi:MAG TPA: hypothetical protein VGG01_05580 [Xanthobacteraceae bacterium]|jgi:hypothetical protein
MNRRSFLLLGLAYAAATPAFGDEPCCGPITAAGHKLTALLDGMNVESLWLAHELVDWKTGARNRPGTTKSTHCSAFAAAAGFRLGVYMLRPPEHGQLLLASAQTRWFNSGAGQADGWRPVASMQEAQEFANQGKLVVISYANPNPQRPGHIVVVRPSTKSAARFALEGPQVIQAATYNRASSPAATSFKAHRGAWPNKVRVFVHDVP